jgi:hypothetical protein
MSQTLRRALAGGLAALVAVTAFGTAGGPAAAAVASAQFTA